MKINWEFSSALSARSRGIYRLTRLLYIGMILTGCRRCDDTPLSPVTFGPGEWPPALWRPYSNESPFNTPIPPDAKPHPNSDSIIARILNNGKRPGNLIANVDGNSGEPTYYIQPNDPSYYLERTMKIWDSFPFEGTKIQIPLGARVEKDSAAATAINQVFEIQVAP